MIILLTKNSLLYHSWSLSYCMIWFAWAVHILWNRQNKKQRLGGAWDRRAPTYSDCVHTFFLVQWENISSISSALTFTFTVYPKQVVSINWLSCWLFYNLYNSLTANVFCTVWLGCRLCDKSEFSFRLNEIFKMNHTQNRFLFTALTRAYLSKVLKVVKLTDILMVLRCCGLSWGSWTQHQSVAIFFDAH